MSIIIKKKPNLEKLSVSELYSTLTGKSWSAAKSEGLTNGSYKQNMALRAKLLNQVAEDNTSAAPEKEVYEGWFADMPVEKKEKAKKKKTNDFSKAGSFGAAFNAALAALGENDVFRYKGKMFTTNLGKASIKKASIKKADKEEEEDWDELPLDDVVLNKSTKRADTAVKDLTDEAIQLEMQESLYDPSGMSYNQEEFERQAARNRADNKMSWIMHNILYPSYKKGGILPFKYKNGGDGDDDDKKKKKKEKGKEHLNKKNVIVGDRNYGTSNDGGYSVTPKKQRPYVTKEDNRKSSYLAAKEDEGKPDSPTMTLMRKMQAKTDKAKLEKTKLEAAKLENNNKNKRNKRNNRNNKNK